MKKLVLSTILGVSLTLCVSVFQGAEAARKAVSNNTNRTKLFKGRVSYQIAKGENLWLQRKYVEAQDAFRKEIQKHPRNLDAAAGLGLSLVMQFKLDGAEEQFDKVLAKQPDNALAHTGKAMVNLNRLQSSSKTFIDRRNHLLADAESQVRAALDSDPTLPQAHFALGSVLKEANRASEAYDHFKEATTIDPSYSDAYAQMAALDLANERYDAAEANARQALSRNTANSTAHWALGELLLRKNDVDGAIKALNTSLYLYNNSAPVHLALGKAYERQGNVDAALKSYEKASLIKPELQEPYQRTVALHIALGNQYEAKDNTVGALKEYRQATLIDPHNPEPYMHMASLREKRGDLELAISELRSGVELNPQSSQLYQRIGDASLKLEKIDDAIKNYDRALSLQPGNSAIVDNLSRAWYLKAQKETSGSFLMSNEFESARTSLEKAIKLNPDNLRLRLAGAKLRALAGEEVNLASVGTPTNDAERVAYAEALLAQNKFAEAHEQMNTVINNTSQAQEAAALGDLALMIKDLDSARSAYKKAADLGQVERARRGVLAVMKVREESRRSATLARDLAKKKQLASAVDNYRLATASNPLFAEARLGLAESEERLAPKSPTELRDAAQQYRAYLSLSPNLPEKQQMRIAKRVQKIEERAGKLEQKLAIANK